MSATASLGAPVSLRASLGRCFVGPAFDYLLIGGALSLPVVALLAAGSGAPGVGALVGRLEVLTRPEVLPWVVLLLSGTHFAASSVRLYTKPGATRALPFLTMAFPLVALAILTLSVLRPVEIGRHLSALYITWSPYHYAAQAYGLAVMYCYRSGCALSPADKRMLRVASLLPFFYAFVASGGAGLDWLLPEALAARPEVAGLVRGLRPLLVAAGLAAPVLVWAALHRGRGAPMPFISALALFANGIWWFALPPLQAFVWATFFHAIQYLAIVLIFHVRERMARPGNRRHPLYHVLWFYGTCLAVAYGLFNCLPRAYVLAGFSLTDSLLLVVAAINLHHFIVDAYIWRLGRSDGNRAIVEGAPAAPPAWG